MRHDRIVNDRTVGRVIRLLRRRSRERQQDLADRVGVSQGAVSAAEAGRLGRMTVDAIRRMLAAYDADVYLSVRWRHGVVERLLDETHAELVGLVADRLTRWGWETVPEVSYSIYGERGSIDLVAWHAATRTLLILEIKTDLVSLEATLRKLDEKVRLGPTIAVERFGWRPQRAARLLVLPAEPTARRHVAHHAAVLDRALPTRGTDVRGWLRQPGSRPLAAGIWFVAKTQARTDAAA
jgi:transcriptional regulator with XRE-family HTH domain